MKTKFFILSILICFSTLIKSQDITEPDHLQPNNSVWGLFDHQFESDPVRRVLFKDLSDSPEIRFVTLPSFTPESVLDVQEIDGDYYLIYRIGDRMIWSNENIDQIKVEEYKVKIDSRSVELIKSLFLKAIKQTRYPEESNLGLDGVNYYFFVWDYGLKSGTTWSPSNATPRMKSLVGISNKLIELAKSKKEIVSFDEEFTDQVTSLQNKL